MNALIDLDKAFGTPTMVFLNYPRQDSNLCLRLRRPTLYPLSYGGVLCMILSADGCRTRTAAEHGS